MRGGSYFVFCLQHITLKPFRFFQTVIRPHRVPLKCINIERHLDYSLIIRSRCKFLLQRALPLAGSLSIQPLAQGLVRMPQHRQKLSPSSSSCRLQRAFREMVSAMFVCFASFRGKRECANELPRFVCPAIDSCTKDRLFYQKQSDKDNLNTTQDKTSSYDLTSQTGR